MADCRRLLNRIDELRKAGQTLAEVAEQLNREGFHPPKRSATFTSAILSGLLANRSRTGPRPRVVAEPGVLSEHEWLLSDLARKLAMPKATLHRWVRVGWVQARKLPTPGGHWVIWADADGAKLGFNDPRELASHYNVAEHGERLSAIADLLATVVGEAAG